MADNFWLTSNRMIKAPSCSKTSGLATLGNVKRGIACKPRRAQPKRPAAALSHLRMARPFAARTALRNKGCGLAQQLFATVQRRPSFLKQLSVIFAVLLSLFAQPGYAEKLRVPVLMANPEMGAEQMAALFAATTVSDKIELHFVSSLGKNQYPLAITLGEKPLAQAMVTNHNTRSVIALGIDSQRFHAVAEKIKEKQQVKITAIYSDAPIERQLALAKLILPRASSFTYLYKNLHKNELDKLRKAAERESLQMQAARLKRTSDLTRLLNDATENSDFILARKDSSVYNPETIRTILLSSYRRNFVVVGLSKAYVKAGVVATTYSSAEHLVQTLSSYLEHYLETGKLKPPDYPEEFAVAVNRQVANSMDLTIPDDKTLIQHLKEVKHE